MRIFAILAIFSLTACQQAQDQTASAASSPLYVSGFQSLGNVAVGDAISSTVVAVNSSQSAQSISFTYGSQFSFISTSPATCSQTVVPASTTCRYVISFLPTMTGYDELDVSAFGASTSISGTGVTAGSLTYDLTTYAIGTTTAGTSQSFIVNLTNSGSTDAFKPEVTFSMANEGVVTTTSCESVITSGSSCAFQITLTPKTASATYVDTITFDSAGTTNHITASGVVDPSDAYGTITLTNQTAYDAATFLKAGTVGMTLVTSQITDRYSNSIAASQPVTVSAHNGLVSTCTTLSQSSADAGVGACTWAQSISVTPVSGVATFSIKGYIASPIASPQALTLSIQAGDVYFVTSKYLTN